MPDDERVSDLAWAPDDRRVAVALRNGGVYVLPDHRWLWRGFEQDEDVKALLGPGVFGDLWVDAAKWSPRGQSVLLDVFGKTLSVPVDEGYPVVLSHHVLKRRTASVEWLKRRFSDGDLRSEIVGWSNDLRCVLITTSGYDENWDGWTVKALWLARLGERLERVLWVAEVVSPKWTDTDQWRSLLYDAFEFDVDWNERASAATVTFRVGETMVGYIVTEGGTADNIADGMLPRPGVSWELSPVWAELDDDSYLLMSQDRGIWLGDNGHHFSLPYLVAGNVYEGQIKGAWPVPYSDGVEHIATSHDGTLAALNLLTHERSNGTIGTREEVRVLPVRDLLLGRIDSSDG